ncbi:MAG TPA: hypothetical protein VIV27_00680, partial [Halioglobus sp.]
MHFRHFSLKSAIFLLPALLSVPGVRADDDVAAIRAELDALKAQYETRIQALEQHLQEAEQQLASTQQSGVDPAAVANPSVAATPNPALTPVDNGTAASGNAFNPAIGVILNGAYRAYEKNPDDYVIPGVPPGGNSGLAEEGFSAGESEFVFTANVDDWFYGRVTTALEQDGDSFDTSLEEAFIDTLSMPANTSLRFGRYFSSVGYLNEKHSHTWDFADQALPYRVFLDTQYGDDGLQFSGLAPTDIYLQLGGEIFRGSSYPAAGDAHDGAGTYTLFTHIGGDVGFSNSWTAGLSWLKAEAHERNDGVEGVDGVPLQFDGNTEIAVADFVWKWAPNGNISDRNLKFQTEYLWRNENGDYLLADPAVIDADSSGWYAQLVYQWRPQ